MEDRERTNEIVVYEGVSDNANEIQKDITDSTTNTTNKNDSCSSNSSSNNERKNEHKSDFGSSSHRLPLFAISNIVSYLPSAIPLEFIAAHPTFRASVEQSSNRLGICIRDFCVLPVNRSLFMYYSRPEKSVRQNANITISVENDAVMSTLPRHTFSMYDTKQSSCNSPTTANKDSSYQKFTSNSLICRDNSNNQECIVHTKHDVQNNMQCDATSESANLHTSNSSRSLTSSSSFSSYTSSSSAHSFLHSTNYNQFINSSRYAIELDAPRFGGVADHYYPAVGEECVPKRNNSNYYYYYNNFRHLCRDVGISTYNYCNYHEHCGDMSNRNTVKINRSRRNNNNNNNFNAHMNNVYINNNNSSSSTNNNNNISQNTSQQLNFCYDINNNFNDNFNNSNSCSITCECDDNYGSATVMENNCHCQCKTYITYASAMQKKTQTSTEELVLPHLNNCSHSGDHELERCAAIECASTLSLHLTLNAAWWLSRYYGISLRLTGMTPHQLPLFEQIRNKLLLKELILIDCVLNEEWMQCISSCTELISLTLYSCTANNKSVTLHTVHSILSRPQSPLPTHGVAAAAAAKANHQTSSPKVCSNEITENENFESEEQLLQMQTTSLRYMPQSCLDKEYKENCQESIEYNAPLPVDLANVCTQTVTSPLPLYNTSNAATTTTTTTNISNNKNDNTKSNNGNSKSNANVAADGSETRFVVGTCALGRLARLRHLHLIDTPVLPSFFEYLTQCPSLECVMLHKVKSVQEGLPMITSLTQLTTLSLHGLYITDDMTGKFFQQLRSLQFLAIDACWHLHHFEFLSLLAHSLHGVSLSRCWCDDTGIMHLASCVKLTQLQLHSLKRVRHLEPLASLTLLERLSISDILLPDYNSNSNFFSSNNNATSNRIINAITAQMHQLRYCNFVWCRPNAVAITSTKAINGQTRTVSPTMNDSVMLHFTKNTQDQNNNTAPVNDKVILSNLVSVNLSHTSHEAIQMDISKLLTRCNTLRYVNFAGCHLSDLSSIFLSAPSLRWFNVSETNVQSSMLSKCLTEATKIRYLNLNSCPGITSLAFAHSCRSLRFLEIANNTNCRNIDVELRMLAEHCKQLVYINVSQSVFITNLSFARKLRYLRELNLSYTSLTQSSMEVLVQCCYLEVLNISHCTHVHDLSSLLQLRSLQVLFANHLNLHANICTSTTSAINNDNNNHAITSNNSRGNIANVDTDAYTNASSSGLCELHLHKCVFASINNNIVNANNNNNNNNNSNMINSILETLLLCCAHTLQTLDISCCLELTTLNLHVPLRVLEHLNAAHTKLNNNALHSIGQCTQLRWLDLSACPNITSTEELSSLKELTVLNLSHTNATNKGIKPLSQCNSLSVLYLSENHTINDVNCLSTLQHLTILHLENTSLHTKGVAKLAQCTSLEELYLTKCSLLTSVKLLRESLPKLRVLDVYGTAVDDRVAGQPVSLPCTIM